MNPNCHMTMELDAALASFLRGINPPAEDRNDLIVCVAHIARCSALLKVMKEGPERDALKKEIETWESAVSLTIAKLEVRTAEVALAELKQVFSLLLKIVVSASVSI